MIFLFIGGNSDGQELDVPEHMNAFRVADKIEQSFSIDTLPLGPRGSCLYTKRAYRYLWNETHYFAASDLGDEEALKRYLECCR